MLSFHPAAPDLFFFLSRKQVSLFIYFYTGTTLISEIPEVTASSCLSDSIFCLLIFPSSEIPDEITHRNKKKNEQSCRLISKNMFWWCFHVFKTETWVFVTNETGSGMFWGNPLPRIGYHEPFQWYRHYRILWFFCLMNHICVSNEMTISS